MDREEEINNSTELTAYFKWVEEILKDYSNNLRCIVRVVGFNKSGKSTLCNEMIGFFSQNPKLTNGLFSLSQDPMTNYKTLYFFDHNIKKQIAISHQSEHRYDMNDWNFGGQDEKKRDFEKKAKGINFQRCLKYDANNLPCFFQVHDEIKFKKYPVKNKTLDKFEKIHILKQRYFSGLKLDLGGDIRQKIELSNLCQKYRYLLMKSNFKILDDQFLTNYTCLVDQGGLNDFFLQSVREEEKDQADTLANELSKIKQKEKQNYFEKVTSMKNDHIKKKKQQFINIQNYKGAYIYVHNIAVGSNNVHLQEYYLKFLASIPPSRIIICYNFIQYRKYYENITRKMITKIIQIVFKDLPLQLYQIYKKGLEQFSIQRHGQREKEILKNRVQNLQRYLKANTSIVNNLIQQLQPYYLLESQIQNEKEEQNSEEEEGDYQENEIRINQASFASLMQLLPLDGVFHLVKSQFFPDGSPLDRFFKSSRQNLTRSMKSLFKQDLVDSYVLIEEQINKKNDEIKNIWGTEQRNEAQINLLKEILKKIYQFFLMNFEEEKEKIQTQIKEQLQIWKQFIDELIRQYGSRQVCSVYLYSSKKQDIGKKIQKQLNKSTDSVKKVNDESFKRLKKLMKNVKNFDLSTQQIKILQQYWQDKKTKKIDRKSSIKIHLIKTTRTLTNDLIGKLNVHYLAFWNQLLVFKKEAFLKLNITIELTFLAIESFLIGLSAIVVRQLVSKGIILVGNMVLIAGLGLALNAIVAGVTIGWVTHKMYKTNKKLKQQDEIFFREQWEHFVNISQATISQAVEKFQAFNFNLEIQEYKRQMLPILSPSESLVSDYHQLVGKIDNLREVIERKRQEIQSYN